MEGTMKGKKWDVYVYGDVNIDLVVPGVSSLPKPGQEDEVPVMDTYVGGGAALVCAWHWKARSASGISGRGRGRLLRGVDSQRICRKKYRRQSAWDEQDGKNRYFDQFYQ